MNRSRSETQGRFSEGARKMLASRQKCAESSSGFQGGFLSSKDWSPKMEKRRKNSVPSLNCKDLKAQLKDLKAVPGFATPFAARDVSSPSPLMPISQTQVLSGPGGRRHSIHSISYTDFQSICKIPTDPSHKAQPWAVPCGSAVNAVKERPATSDLGPRTSKWGVVKGAVLLGAMQKSSSDTDLGGRRGSVRLPPMASRAGKLPPLDKDLKLSVQITADSPRNKRASKDLDTPSTVDAGDSNWSDGETKDDSENDSLPDINFVIPDSPTLMEALQRFQTGNLSDTEIRRIQRAFRRFAAQEDDLDKECLDLVTSHLGYILAPEEDMETMASNVSGMSCLDLEELLSFLQGCGSGQRELVKAAFEKQATAEGTFLDYPPTISLDGLAAVMKELHLITLRDNLNELLLRASIADKTSFSFDDVARVLAAYRTCEGFTVESLKEAQEKYDEATEEKPMTVEDLPDALLDFFGVHCVKQLRELVEAAGEALSYCGTHTAPISFHEFIIWARHLQNAFLLELCEHFESEDGDEDGKVTFDEMMSIMKDQGFTLTRAEVIEFLKSADLEMGEDVSYSFDDMHTLLMACRESEGFMEKDLEELKDVYKKFDTEDEGELTTLQVLDLLRFLGYQVQVSDVEFYAKQVDFNGNGTMDEDEYMRLMRLHREDEIAEMQKVFFSTVGSVRGRLPFANLHTALKASKCCSSHCDVFNDICQAAGIDETSKDFSFDEFRALADQGRKAVKIAQRKKASFTDTEFAILQQAFVEFDTHNDGKLEHGRLLILLHRCGVPVQTENRWGVDMLDQARQAATAADLSEEMVGKMGSTSMTFWSMIHAWRMIARGNEEKQIAKIEDARVACNFSTTEVEEFRKVFTERTKKSSEEEVEDPASQGSPSQERGNGRRRSMPDLYTANPKDMQETTRQMLDTAKSNGTVKNSMTVQEVLGTNEVLLAFHDFKKVLGNLKLKMGPRHVHLLENEMYDLTGCTEGALDFPNFLRIMRWMLDTDFAHLNDVAASVAKSVETTTKAGPAVEEQEGLGLGGDMPKAWREIVGRRASV